MDFEKERKRILKLKRPLSLQELAILSGKDPATLDLSMCERCKPYGECSGFRDLSDEEWEAINKLVDEERDALLLQKKLELKSCSAPAKPVAHSTSEIAPEEDFYLPKKEEDIPVLEEGWLEKVLDEMDKEPCARCLPYGECRGLKILTEDQWQALKALTDPEGMEAFAATYGLERTCVR
jgi:hypothetical protein